jgi:hypothetical protein
MLTIQWDVNSSSELCSFIENTLVQKKYTSIEDFNNHSELRLNMNTLKFLCCPTTDEEFLCKWNNINIWMKIIKSTGKNSNIYIEKYRFTCFIWNKKHIIDMLNYSKEYFAHMDTTRVHVYKISPLPNEAYWGNFAKFRKISQN